MKKTMIAMGLAAAFAAAVFAAATTDWPPQKEKESVFTGRKLEIFQHGIKPEWGYAAPQRDTFLVLHPKQARMSSKAADRYATPFSKACTCATAACTTIRAKRSRAARRASYSSASASTVPATCSLTASPAARALLISTTRLMAMIMRAEPLPAFPPSMPQPQLDLTVPIRFSLR